MNRKIILLFAFMFLLACNFLLPERSTTQVMNTPSVDSSNRSEPSESVTMPGFTIARIHPEEGGLQTQVAAEAQKAISLGLMPIVEFDATWCPPCQKIDAAINAKDDLMLMAYAGTYIIKVDVDEWGWDGGGVQEYRFEGIPVYFVVDENGKQTGKVIDGGAWGEDIPENIAPVMDEFFHGD